MESKTPPPSKSHGALWLRLGLDLHITCTQTNYRCLTTQVTCGLQVTIFLTKCYGNEPASRLVDTSRTTNVNVGSV